MISVQEPLILIYYSFRGLAQPIRNVLCYLDLPYSQVHLDRFQQQSQELLPHILQHFKKFKINKNQLPAIIHGQTYIENVHPILVYVVRKFQRSDLLGSSIQTRTRVKEFMEIYFSQQHIVYEVLRLAQYCSKHTLPETNARCKDLFEDIMNGSKYIRQLSQYLDRQENPAYIFKELTVIDFLYFQACQYILAIFDNQQRVYKQDLANANSQGASFLSKPNSYYLKIMKSFYNQMIARPNYQKYEGFLESFNMKCPLFNQSKKIALQKIWLGNINWIA